MKFKFEEREKEIMRGLLFTARNLAKKSENKEVTKQVDRMVNQIADNSDTTKFRGDDVTQLGDILDYVLSDADKIDENGLRGLSEEDENTIKSIVGKIQIKQGVKKDIEISVN